MGATTRQGMNPSPTGSARRPTTLPHLRLHPKGGGAILGTCKSTPTLEALMLQLHGTFSPNPRMAPLIDGTVKPEGIEITFESGQAGELHERHLRDNAFDVFEFSISHY